MVAASAAFGNSFTLPAVFLTTLLPAPLADRALGYAALFLLAWSPCLWSIGLALISGKDQRAGQPRQQSQQQQVAAAGSAGPGAAAMAGSGGSGSPKPLAWRQPRAVDVTPLSASDASVDGDPPEPPSWAQQLVEHPAAARLGQFASQVGARGSGHTGASRAGPPRTVNPTHHSPSHPYLYTPYPCPHPLPQVLNPPVVAILAGMAVGLTPAGRALLVATQPSSTAAVAGAAIAAPAALPPELGLLQAVVKAALEVGQGRAGVLVVPELADKDNTGLGYSGVCSEGCIGKGAWTAARHSPLAWLLPSASPWPSLPAGHRAACGRHPGHPDARAGSLPAAAARVPGISRSCGPGGARSLGHRRGRHRAAPARLAGRAAAAAANRRDGSPRPGGAGADALCGAAAGDHLGPAGAGGR